MLQEFDAARKTHSRELRICMENYPSVFCKADMATAQRCMGDNYWKLEVQSDLCMHYLFASLVTALSLMRSMQSSLVTVKW